MAYFLLTGELVFGEATALQNLSRPVHETPERQGPLLMRSAQARALDSNGAAT